MTAKEKSTMHLEIKEKNFGSSITFVVSDVFNKRELTLPKFQVSDFQINQIRERAGFWFDCDQAIQDIKQTLGIWN
ncbi:hypothetical protein HMPREF0819_1495 [Streptococcus equinus ATCC 9812]|uniref:Uncharacterized protein n=2 Tax=Streptococcus equinus TaxID=1335 RepID=E8JR72_STREI|nr:hypothetical protein HMPREF0819_1495 [Streptococcus equinus ATCC 9812]